MAVIYSGGPLEGEIPDLDFASFTLRRAKELGDKPAPITPFRPGAELRRS